MKRGITSLLSRRTAPPPAIMSRTRFTIKTPPPAARLALQSSAAFGMMILLSTFVAKMVVDNLRSRNPKRHARNHMPFDEALIAFHSFDMSSM